jgi:hypothetical protein
MSATKTRQMDWNYQLTTWSHKIATYLNHRSCRRNMHEPCLTYHKPNKSSMKENQNSYSDEEVKLITELLFRWAQLTVDTYYEGDDQNS